MQPESRSRLAVVSITLGLLALVGACSTDPVVPVDRLPAALGVPALSTEGWRTLERPGFSMRVPPGFEDAGVQPIDSDAGLYRKGEASTLQYDYGAYGGRGDVPAGADEVLQDVRTRIGGREATMVAYREGGEWVVGARWEAVASSSLGELGLNVGGRTPLPEVRDQILAAIHSVRFP